MSKHFIIGYILLISSFCYAQSDSLKKIADKNIYARQQLLMLQKEGTVIVLLKGKTRAMEAYEKAGKTLLVEDMKKKIATTNRTLVRAFNKYWKFSPVLYMYNDDIATLQKNGASKVFVDSLLKPSPFISLTQSYYVFMDYGSYYIPSNNTSENQPTKWKKNQEETVQDPTQSNQSITECLVVKDKNLNQFLAPYPNRSASIMGSKDMNNLVAALNRRFEAFLENK